jgi:hypothetical protein
MEVGDKVKIYGMETEIIATAFDEVGEKVYVLEGMSRDFYEYEINTGKYDLLESIVDLAKDDLKAGNRDIHATLGYEELIQLSHLLDEKRELEMERDGIYADYQDLGKELAKLQDDGDHIPRID